MSLSTATLQKLPDSPQAGLIYGISYAQGNSGWRAALSVTFIPSTLLLLVLLWVPESREAAQSPNRPRADLLSARYLYEKKRYMQCREVLARLHGGHKEEDGSVFLSDAAEVEFEAMRAGELSVPLLPVEPVLT